MAFRSITHRSVPREGGYLLPVLVKMSKKVGTKLGSKLKKSKDAKKEPVKQHQFPFTKS